MKFLILSLGFLLLCLPAKADSTVVLNEIMYHPATNETQFEWVELYNQMAVDMDLSGWYLTNAIRFTFPEGTILQGGGYLVVSISPSTLSAAAGITNVVGPFSGRLANSGDIVELRNMNGRLMDSVSYQVEDEWPVSPDGGGASLAKADPDAGSSKASNWQASEQIGGTPGRLNFPRRVVTFSNSVPLRVDGIWRYEDSGADLGTAWRQIAYSDNTWKTGAGLFYVNGTQPPGAELQSISTLFSSGVDTNGVVLAAGAADPHYFLTASAQGAPPPPIIPATVMQNHPAWGANDVISSWIGPVSAGTANLAPGNYNYRTLFDLSHYVHSNATVVLSFEVDNNLNDVQLNGTSLGFAYAAFAGFSGNYSITNGFLPGTNVLDFLTSNAGATANPEGFRVRASGTAPARLPLATQLSGLPITCYFRSQFTYAGEPAATRLNLRPVMADGAVVYLNGAEVLRVNMPAGPINASTFALSRLPNANFAGPFVLPAQGLINGTNVIAVEVHQAAAGENDLTFGTELSLSITNFPPPPLPALAFNEVTASTNSIFSVELINYGTQPIALADKMIISYGTSIVRASLPNQVLAPGDLLLLDQTALGAKPKSGDILVLYSAGGLQPLDGIVVKKISRARFPDGTGPWLRPAAETPGSSNTVALHQEIVINEIMYHHFPLMPRPSVFATNTLVPITNGWRYNQAGVDLGTAWRDPAYNDGAWASGRALFYSTPSSLGAPKNTQLLLTNGSGTRLITWYFRAPFVFNGDPSTTQIALRPFIDDGAVFYLNSKEVYRLNMPIGAISYTNLASVSVATATFTGPFTLLTTNLVQGTNWLAVEVHQVSTNALGADVVFGTEVLTINQVTPGNSFQELPEGWVELYNRSTNSVDLGGWKFSKGIDFTFPLGTTMAPGGYLVVANDALALSALYPNINVIGNFQKSLSSSHEVLLLADAIGNPACRVEYYDTGSWPEYPDGGGSTLELKDPFADVSRPEAWAASIEGTKASWSNISYRAVATADGGPTLWKEFVMELLSAGECLFDDLVVTDLTAGGGNLIQNGAFEAGSATWRLQGTHDRSEVIPEPGNAGNHVLHLVSTGPSDYMVLHNHAETTLAGGVSVINGHEYQISYRAKWLAGANQLNTRLYFNRCPQTVFLPVPSLNGTPGAPNSTYATNIGPTFVGFQHAPLVPGLNDPVTVSVVASDPQGVASCLLWWKRDGAAWNNTPMTADGLGKYSGTIPPQPAGSLIQFHVQGTDTLGASSFSPAEGTNARALYVVEDGQVAPPKLHFFRILMTAADVGLTYAATNVMSEDRIGCTILYDNRKVFYNTSLRLQGSERGRMSDSRVGFSLEFPPEDPFRGVHGRVSVDKSGGYSGIGGQQDEIVLKQIMNHAGGMPSMYDDLVYVIAPRSANTGTGILLMARYTSEFLKNQYVNGSEGGQFKLELIYFPTTTVDGNPQSWKLPQPDDVIGSDIQDLGNSKESYRWFLLIQNNYQRDDYSPMINLGKTFSLTGSALDAATSQYMDLDEWARTFALKMLGGDVDTYGTGYPHNFFVYFRPEDNRALAMLWDQDFAWTGAANASLFPISNVGKIIARPQVLRLFYGHLADIIASSYNTTYVGRWAPHYASLVGQNYNGIVNYVGQRAAYVTSQLPPPVPFSITTSNGANFMVDTPFVNLAGTAGTQIKNLVISELAAQPTFAWPTVSAWQATIPLSLGANPLTFIGYDFRGNIVSSNRITITSTSTNSPSDSDGDGLPDSWELASHLNPYFAGDALLDSDGDGLTNLQEYLAGTDPWNPNSFLRVDAANTSPGNVTIVAAALAGRSYSLLARPAPDSGPWTVVTNWAPVSSNRILQVTQPIGAAATKFYRLATPRLP